MIKKPKLRWIEPRIVNLDQLPTTLGVDCNSGATAGAGGGPPGQIRCLDGGIAGNSQCRNGNTEDRN